MRIEAGTLKIVHVNRNSIQHNAKHSDTLPVWRVQRGGTTYYCDGVEFDGPVITVYQPSDPLKCGAKLWLETTAAIRLIQIRERLEPVCLLNDAH